MKLLGVFAWISLVIAGCGSSKETGGTTPSSSGAAAPNGLDAGPAVCTADIAPPETRNVSCAVTLMTPALQEPASKHLQEGTSIAYCTNPPTSGPHYPVWAEFTEFKQPVDWPYLVHSEEHGGVLLLYKCDPECPDIVEALRAVRDRSTADPTCETEGRPGTKRIVIAPSTTIPSRVAAAAWGAIYTADCADPATLDEFVATHRGKGPEDICFAGRLFSTP